MDGFYFIIFWCCILFYTVWNFLNIRYYKTEKRLPVVPVLKVLIAGSIVYITFAGLRGVEMFLLAIMLLFDNLLLVVPSPILPIRSLTVTDAVFTGLFICFYQCKMYADWSVFPVLVIILIHAFVYLYILLSEKSTHKKEGAENV